MAQPKKSDEVKLKRLVRYLAHKPVGVYQFSWQSPVTTLHCFVDSDWAGCSRTRRSTSGGILMRGGHCLHQWSRTQTTVALSSGEAELNAALKGGIELLGAQSLLHEFGEESQLELLGDSVACHGTLHREGAGRIKHLEVRQLWLQQKIKSGIMSYTKIPREINPADSLAKSWTVQGLSHFDQIGFRLHPHNTDQ